MSMVKDIIEYETNELLCNHSTFDHLRNLYRNKNIRSISRDYAKSKRELCEYCCNKFIKINGNSEYYFKNITDNYEQIN